eukprot:900559-Amphidinium_carterae.1
MTPRSSGRQQASNGFHVEIFADRFADVAAASQAGAWWANGPPPAWLSRLHPSSTKLMEDGHKEHGGEMTLPPAAANDGALWGPPERLNLAPRSMSSTPCDTGTNSDAAPDLVT